MMHFCLLRFTVVLKSAPQFWKVLVLEFLLSISEIFRYFMSAL
jgi:hypothetical protein